MIVKNIGSFFPSASCFFFGTHVGPHDTRHVRVPSQMRWGARVRRQKDIPGGRAGLASLAEIDRPPTC